LVFGLFRVPLSWTAIAGRTLREIDEDHCCGLAAQLAVYFLLALFPALLLLVALLAYLPVENALRELAAAVGTLAPRELVVLLQGQLEQIGSGNSTRGSSVGIIR
jgi:membrane protein